MWRDPSVAISVTKFFWESEADCTSERRVGQFSIFGAVEEKSEPLISQENADAKNVEG